MIAGLSDILSHRIWFVPDVVVWGVSGFGEVAFLSLEQVGSDKTVLFGSFNVGDGSQVISFADLVDYRGNTLPATINTPRILIRSHSPDAVFIVGTESDSSFKIARDSESSEPVTVDLFILEMEH